MATHGGATAKDLTVIIARRRTPCGSGVTNLADVAGADVVRPLTSCVGIVVTIHTAVNINYQDMLE